MKQIIRTEVMMMFNYKEHIKEYNQNTISQGYLCSTCDPFLLLLSELFKNHNSK